MKLIDYLHQLPADQREHFAQACETSVGHLRNVAYGYRPCAPELAAMIEEKSHKAVTRQELCPGKWRRIWPELAEERGIQVAQALPPTAPAGQGVAHA